MDTDIHYTEINGAELSQVGYDEIMKTLYVRLYNGKLVVYYDVPVSEHIGLLSAKDSEEFYNQKIKDSFRNREVYSS